MGVVSRPRPSSVSRSCRGLRLVRWLPQWVKCKESAAVQETQVQSLGGEKPLEQEMATHSSILAWKIPWTEEPRGLLSVGAQRLGRD